jgi:hypothetical protein
MSVPHRPVDECARIDVLDSGRGFVVDTGEGATDEQADPRDEDAPAPAETPTREEGDITGFSADSRRRLRERVHNMRRDAEGLFLTLTYHETDPHPRLAKQHLDQFWKRLRRRFSGISAIWKMEPQKRGTVHFHLIVYGVDFIPVQKLSALWHDVTSETSSQHLMAGLDLERCVNEDGKVQAYLSKYMQETVTSPWEDPGRWWGCLGRDALPWASWSTAKYLDRSEAQAIIESYLRKWGVELPEGVSLPCLRVHTTGDPHDELEQILR